MKKIVAMLLAAALMLALGAGALATTYLYATGDVNLRTGPGLGYSDILTVKKGAKMVYNEYSEVDARGVTWYYVYYNGHNGYVSSRFSSFTKGGSGSSGSYYSGGSSKVYASGGDTNVRSGPGLDFDDIGTLKKGNSLTYLGETSYDGRGVAWYLVRYKGSTGWVSSRYTSFSSSGSGSSGSYYSGGSGSGTVYASDGDTNVRSGPGLDFADIGTLKEGNSLDYLGSTSYDGRGVAWYLVRYKGSTGWVSSKYTTLYEDYVEGTVYASDGDTNVRSGPGLDYKQLGTLKQGCTLDYLGTTTYDARGVAWYSVEYNGGTGWVSSKYTELW